MNEQAIHYQSEQPSHLSPRISVVIPLYNKEHHIRETLESIEQQTYSPFEVVVIDDGSTDLSSEQVEEYLHDVSDISYPIRLIHQLNAGVSVARNRGIRASKGEYVAFLDADDQWLPHFLEEINHLINRFNSAEVFATAYQLQYDHHSYAPPKVVFKKTPFKPQLLHNYFEVSSNGNLPFMMSSVVFEKTTFSRIGTFPEGEAMGEDQDLFCRAALNCEIAYSPKALTLYAMDSENKACKLNIPEQECPFSQRLHQQLSPNEIPKKLYESVIDYTAAHILNLAKLNVEAGNLNSARKLLNDPRCLRRPLKKLVNEARFSLKYLSHQLTPQKRI